MVTYKIKKDLIKNHIMNKQEKILRLQTQLNEWTARLNKSRKNSLRAMRAMHVNHIRAELEKLGAEPGAMSEIMTRVGK